MSAEPVSLYIESVRRMANAITKRGFRVLRVHHNDKNPVDRGWPEKATADRGLLDQMFPQNGPNFNLGVACGPQPNGINLVVIDVDTKHDGINRWDQMVEINEIPKTATHITPSGGRHVFFNCPFPLSNTAALGAGIDVRGFGGQVVVPPSTRIVDGDVVAYTAAGTLGLWICDVADMPEWLCEMLRPIERSVERHPSKPRPAPSSPTGPLDNADWLRLDWDWWDHLEPLGYEIVSERGDQIFVRHPTATSEKSAVIHTDTGTFVGWSTNMPSPWRDRQRNSDGSVTWSPFDWFVAVECGGDASEATRRVNKMRGFGGGRFERAASEAPPGGDDAPLHRLPVVDPSYWDASARNRMIYQAAKAAMVSPDALDLVVFALEATLIPPEYLLPRIVGGQQPLNMLACLVAPTGMFKTSTLDAARDLMGPFPPWVVQIGMGSGEGIGATFLEEEYELNEKGTGKHKTGRLVRNNVRAAFFEADEGSNMTDIAARSGATIIANLCKAWSGSTLGEANANGATRRHVLDRDYRIAALVNIQPSNFAGLFSVANTGTGLTGRFMFSGTADYDIPDDDTPWPGILEHPSFPAMPVTLEIDDSIIARAKAEIRRRHREASLDSIVEAVGQNAAVIARMAGIAVLVDGRRRITEDDWAVAQMRATTSAACLDTLANWAVAKRFEADDREAKKKARTNVTLETEANRLKLGQTVDRILVILEDGPMSGGNITAKLAPSMRDFREGALDTLVEMGKVRLEGKRWARL